MASRAGGWIRCHGYPVPCPHSALREFSYSDGGHAEAVRNYRYGASCTQDACMREQLAESRAKAEELTGSLTLN